MITHITSRENDRVKYVKRLAAQSAFRAEEGLFFAEGKRLCFDLAKSKAPKVVFATRSFLEQYPETARLGEELNTVNDGVAEKLSETKSPQGLYCLFEMPATEAPGLLPEKGILMCEELQDPANVGAVIRSAAGLGFGGVALCGPCADPFGPKALRASMGSVLRLPLCRFDNMAKAADFLKENDGSLYAAALEGAVPLTGFKPAAAFGLMIGNEGAGLSAEALALADTRLFIPMAAGVESLNAAAAAAVMMYGLKAAMAE